METEIILRVIVHHNDRETDNILDTKNAYELKQNISFPYGAETTLFVGNKIIIDEKTYSITEIYFDIFNPNSSLGHNTSLSISVTEVEDTEI